jgi:hypothetical protein
MVIRTTGALRLVSSSAATVTLADKAALATVVSAAMEVSVAAALVLAAASTATGKANRQQAGGRF